MTFILRKYSIRLGERYSGTLSFTDWSAKTLLYALSCNSRKWTIFLIDYKPTFSMLDVRVALAKKTFLCVGLTSWVAGGMGCFQPVFIH